MIIRFYMIKVSVSTEINWMSIIHLSYNILKHNCGVRKARTSIGFK